MKIYRNIAYVAGALMAVLAISSHYATAQTTTTSTTISNVPIIRVLSISRRGNVLIDGVVTNVNGEGTNTSTPSGTVVVGTWAGDWTMNVSSTLKFSRISGLTSNFGEIQPGDRVQVIGRVTRTNQVIDATKILDRSLQRHTLIGTVSAATGNEFTLNITGTQFKGKTAIVQPQLSDTVTITGNGVNSFNGINDGMKATVIGDLNRSNGTMYAIRIIVSGTTTTTPTTTTPTPTPSPTTNPIPTTTNPTATSVSIANFAFNPASVTITSGSKVTWTNNDSVAHTVTADNGSFDSGPISPGASYSHTFSSSGTVAYHCSIHPNMHGSVIVQ